MREVALRAVITAALAALSGCATPIGGASTVKAGAAPAQGAPVFQRTDIIGLDAAALDDLLGPAALVRREGAGEFRRYAFARCALIVILYPDESGMAAARRLDAAARLSGEEGPDVDDCLAGGPAAPQPAS